jgi:glutamine amidotransferase
MIAIINYGLGNIKAIGNIYERLNIPFKIISEPDQLKHSEKLLLPGVGAFDEAMTLLNQSGLRSALEYAALVNKIPVLGICVGMQMLAGTSEEGKLPGLGWIDGEVKKIDKTTLEYKPKLPHLGWNSIKIKKTHDLLGSISEEDGFYFLHSYYFHCHNEQNILATTFYGKEFVSVINNDHIYGVQFHPEKSHSNGIQLLKNFAELKVL